MKSLEHIRIVVVEPAGALNVGSIARAMKNMGLSQLVLVTPRCDHLGEEARLMAFHAADLLEKATVVDTLAAGLKGCKKAIASFANNLFYNGFTALTENRNYGDRHFSAHYMGKTPRRLPSAR